MTYTLEMGPANGLLLDGFVHDPAHEWHDVSDNVSFTAHFSEDNHIEDSTLIQPTEEEADSSPKEVLLGRIGHWGRACATVHNRVDQTRKGLSISTGDALKTNAFLDCS